MRDALGAQDGLYTLVEQHADGDASRVIGSIIELPARARRPARRRSSRWPAETHPHRLADGHRGRLQHQRRHRRVRPRESRRRARPGVRRAAAHDVRARHRGAAPPPRARPRAVHRHVLRQPARNGRLARLAFTTFARLRDPGLADWIGEHVEFPNSMVDRITPATTDDDRRLVAERFGIEDGWPVVCEPFVQWVLEDRFCAGRPAVRGRRRAGRRGRRRRTS